MVLLALSVLLWLAQPALGQGVSRTDPEIGSPAEDVYGIPLEEARRDAAPGFLPGTSLRTENSVGSSSQIPGRRGDRGPEGGARDEERARRRRARRRDAAEAATQISGDPSGVATAALLVLVVGTAAAGGIGAGRLVGRRARL